MAYPSVLSAISNPQPTDRLNSPSHSSIHQAENAAITEIETFVGTISSIPGTLIYDIRSSSSNGGGHVQTANKGGTGQTSYNKGDLLVAQSSSVLTKLTVGADNQALIADASQAVGIKWATPAGANVQTFSSTAVWVKPSALGLLSQVFVEIWGGGGSGGANISGGSNGGAGGGGFYNSGWFTASVLGATELMVIGLGGASVAATANGNAGGTTVFGSLSSLLTAYEGGSGKGISGDGGGGGGGAFGPGGNGTNTVGGAGGSNGWIGASSLISSGGANTGQGSQDAQNASGGGSASGKGGNTIYGGAGGGSIGGISNFGGNGGNNGVSVVGAPGAQKGGGGGASRGFNGAISGKGGDGFAIIVSLP